MSRRHRMIDMNVPAKAPPGAPVLETKSAMPPRRGPMAAAVRQNDQLAHEHMRLGKLGLIVELIPLDAIDTAKLRRDRAVHQDHELEGLVASIRAIGLSNPIRVEKTGRRYELIQGWRRLQAYRHLLAQTGNDAWATIPAGMVAPGDSIETSYRRMVDENLVRKDISFAEMAVLARDYSVDPQTDCRDADEAVTRLFASAAKQKRSYIRAFAELLGMLEKDLGYPEAIPRNLGMDLRRLLASEGGCLRSVQARLRAAPRRTAEQEVEILRAFVASAEGNSAPAATAVRTVRKARTTFRVSGPHGEIRCSASDGRLELRGPTDFSHLDRGRLQSAVEALLRELAD